MKLKYRVMSALCVSSILTSAIIPISAFATEETVVNENSSETEDSPIFNIFDKSEIIYAYTYENNEVTTSLDSLVERTETLKSNYSLNEALLILENLKDTVKNITETDYKNNYDILHDVNNYETGEFRKYKNSKPVWIIRNVVHLISTKSSDNEDAVKKMIDYMYEMGGIEMQHNCVKYDFMYVVKDLSLIKDRFTPSIQKYLEYVLEIQSDDCFAYDEGTIPDIKIPSEYEEEYNRIQEEKNSSNAMTQPEGTFEDAPIILEDLVISDEEAQKSGTIIADDSAVTTTYDENSMDEYLKQMENIANNSYIEVKTYEIKNVYYTLDKTAENPTWNDTGITVSEDGDIDFSKFILMLGTIEKNVDNSYFFEDSDMIMFIAEGKCKVLNNVEKVTEDELETLFGDFEKIGIKVMLKSDEDIDTSNSLESKLENGEVNQISVNGKKLILTNQPILTKNVLQLPILQVAKELGYSVTQSGNTITLTYEEKAPSSSESSEENTTETSEVEDITTNKITIVLTVGSSNFTVNDVKNSLKTPVTEKDGIVYAEFDKLASKLGYSYSYDADTGVIEFNK